MLSTLESTILLRTRSARSDNPATISFCVSEGFKKELEIVGVGYRAQMKGKKLALTLGFSHPLELDAPAGVTIECPSATQITISGADNEVVGEFAAKVRGYRLPEPYKGKGIRYVGEHVRRKAGKAGTKK